MNFLEMKKWEKRFIKEEKKIIRKKMLNATNSKIFRYFISLFRKYEEKKPSLNVVKILSCVPVYM